MRLRKGVPVNHMGVGMTDVTWNSDLVATVVRFFLLKKCTFCKQRNVVLRLNPVYLPVKTLAQMAYALAAKSRYYLLPSLLLDTTPIFRVGMLYVSRFQTQNMW